jgi:hypothetical protein
MSPSSLFERKRRLEGIIVVVRGVLAYPREE